MSWGISMVVSIPKQHKLNAHSNPTNILPIDILDIALLPIHKHNMHQSVNDYI